MPPPTFEEQGVGEERGSALHARRAACCDARPARGGAEPPGVPRDPRRRVTPPSLFQNRAVRAQRGQRNLTFIRGGSLLCSSDGRSGAFPSAVVGVEDEPAAAFETEACRLAAQPDGSGPVMRCHYIFSVKRQRDGSLEKFKCRLVADGNTQKYGVDFDRIFSTVVKSTTIRMVFIVAAHRRWHLSAIDIAQAYLQAGLTEDLYMMVPPLIPAFDADGDRLVCKLNRSLYGLRQAGREWNTLLVKFIIDWGFKQSSVDVMPVHTRRGRRIHLAFNLRR